jgi:hypothetical protein
MLHGEIKVNNQVSADLHGVYIIHFDKEVKYDKSQRYGDSRHYIGQSVDIGNRIAQHYLGEGSLMTKAAKSQGITMTLAAIFPGGLVEVEQHLTRFGATKLCPLCTMESTPDLSVAANKERRVSGLNRVVTTRVGYSCCQCGRAIRAGGKAQVTAHGMRCYAHVIIERRKGLG